MQVRRSVQWIMRRRRCCDCSRRVRIRSTMATLLGVVVDTWHLTGRREIVISSCISMGGIFRLLPINPMRITATIGADGTSNIIAGSMPRVNLWTSRYPVLAAPLVHSPTCLACFPPRCPPRVESATTTNAPRPKRSTVYDVLYRISIIRRPSARMAPTTIAPSTVPKMILREDAMGAQRITRTTRNRGARSRVAMASRPLLA